MKRLLLASALVLATSSAFASQNYSANIYDSRAALSAQTAELGTVVMTRPVVLKSSGANPGTFIGATVGGAAGYSLARGSSSTFGRIAAGSLGGVLGGAAGQTLGNAGVHHAIQIFVQRYQPNGRPYPQLTSVVEADDQGTFRPGDRVLLVRGRNGLSIVRADVQEAPADQAQTFERGPVDYNRQVQP